MRRLVLPSRVGTLVRRSHARTVQCWNSTAVAATHKSPDDGPTLAQAPCGEAGATRKLPDDGLTLADFMPPKPAPLQPNRKPPWLKMVNPHITQEGGERYKAVRASVKESGVATVCQEARCPNIGECWSSGTATVMIMGDTCTRGCRFCSVATSRKPPALEADEPWRIAKAVTSWGVQYIVLTMVDRDDLADQGAAHVAETVRLLKSMQADLRVETLIGDFQGKLELVEQVVASGMEVFAHNVETVERLQRSVRDRRAGYQQSLSVLQHAKQARPGLVTKSSIMLGLGESDEEVLQTMRDLKDHGVQVVTLGQYLQPTRRHMKVTRYVTPEEFARWQQEGEALGLHVASGPMVRSSYKAKELYVAAFGELPPVVRDPHYAAPARPRGVEMKLGQ